MNIEKKTTGKGLSERKINMVINYNDAGDRSQGAHLTVH